MLKKVWHDPVWSKVISAAFLTALAWIGTRFSTPFGAFISRTVAVPIWLVGLIGIVIVFSGSILLRFARRNRHVEQNALSNPDLKLDENRIQITVSGPGEILSDPRPFGSGMSYMVRGRLRFLPDGHKIWLLSADAQNKRFWPQGWYNVDFNDKAGEWHGRVRGSDVSPMRIVAVVAPPTSHAFFSFYQNHGRKTQDYMPLDDIPAECSNKHSVEARLPRV